MPRAGAIFLCLFTDQGRYGVDECIPSSLKNTEKLPIFAKIAANFSEKFLCWHQELGLFLENQLRWSKF
jgi:hypothetical protein